MTSQNENKSSYSFITLLLKLRILSNKLHVTFFYIELNFGQSMGSICSSSTDRDNKHPNLDKQPRTAASKSSRTTQLSGLDPEQLRFIENIAYYRALRNKADLLYEEREREKKAKFRRIAERNVKNQLKTQNELIKKSKKEERDFVADNAGKQTTKENKPELDPDFYPKNIKSIYLKSCIGSGTFALVHRADVTIKGESEKTFAVKVFKPQKTEKEPVPGYREITVLKQLNHKNIAAYITHGYFEKGPNANSTFLVIEHVSGGCLKDELEKLPKGGAVGLALVKPLAIDISSALSYIHSQGFVHRDIKPANILLQVEKRQGNDEFANNISSCDQTTDAISFKLCDFGSVRKIGDRNDSVFTKTYAAPELLEKGGQLSASSDVFSFGLVLMQCCLGIKQGLSVVLCSIFAQ